MVGYSNENDEIRNGMDFVAGNVEPLRAMVERLCYSYRRIDLAEEMFSDAVIGFADRAYDKFDASINDDLSGWMFSQLQFYCRKWFAKYTKRASRETQIDSFILAVIQAIPNSDDRISALFHRQQVIELLAELSEYEQRLIRLHYGFNNSFEEIADKIGGAPSTLRIHCNQVIAKLQRLTNEGVR